MAPATKPSLGPKMPAPPEAPGLGAPPPPGGSPPPSTLEGAGTREVEDEATVAVALPLDVVEFELEELPDAAGGLEERVIVVNMVDRNVVVCLLGPLRPTTVDTDVETDT